MARKIAVKSLDHVVLSVRSVPKTVAFYTKFLGMTHAVFRAGKNLEQERYVTEFRDGTPQLILRRLRHAIPVTMHSNRRDPELCLFYDSFLSPLEYYLYTDIIPRYLYSIHFDVVILT